MSDKFVWTKANTSLLISLWSDKSVQKNLQDTPRNVAIWNGIARYMKRRGIDVSWLKCRQRMKRLVVRYRLIKRGAKLKPQNMADSFFQELDLVLSLENLKTDSSLCSSSLDISNEATTSVENLLKDPGLIGLHHTRVMHGQTLEFKENVEYLQSPATPNIEPHRHCDRPRHKRPSMRPRPRPRPTSDEFVGDNDPSASSNNVDSVEVVIKTQCDQDSTFLDGAVHLAYVNSTNSDNPYRSGNEEKDPNCMVKEANANESDAITRVLLAQAEATQRVLEANRMRQERLESRIDKIVGQLEQMASDTNQGIGKKLESKLDLIINKLDQIVPHANVRTSEHSLDKKMELVLERLEHIIPCLKQYNSSVPNLVDKMDSMLTGLEKIAPYAYDLIEVQTDE